MRFLREILVGNDSKKFGYMDAIIVVLLIQILTVKTFLCRGWKIFKVDQGR